MEERVHSVINEFNCTFPAIDEFPRDYFTEEQRQSGAVVLHVIASLYVFLALAVVCDEYFVPAVEKICAAFNMSNDVAGATFMAAATSAPEMFVHVIGTFITKGDIGVGTVVGSAVFNILGVAACCGIGAGMAIKLDWWPLTRDCIAYGATVSLLICLMHDERVHWWEAAILVSMYFVYLLIMFFDKSLQRAARRLFNRAKSRSQSTDSNIKPKQSETEKDTEMIESVRMQQNGSLGTPRQSMATEQPMQITSDDDESRYQLLQYPTEKSCWGQIWWLMIWPIHLIFFLTIPNCKKYGKIYPLTFLMCIFFIGSLSYILAWMITVIGDTFKIPDSVMGITFLAAGTSVPEAVSGVIVAKRGYGSMGICNSIGSNTFDILLCLGLPWLIKSAFFPKTEDKRYVDINSQGLEYSAISLLSSLFLLYIAFACNKFTLNKSVGIACLVMYMMFLIFATLTELNFFFPVNLPTCERQ